METFTECDKDDTILTRYWVYLQEVSLAFDATWSPGSEVLIEEGDGGELYGICNCPRSLVWAPSTPKRINQFVVRKMGVYNSPRSHAPCSQKTSWGI
ncbi:hypothetical protein AB1N83_010209 [Pleurotus pulmonarius]